MLIRPDRFLNELLAALWEAAPNSTASDKLWAEFKDRAYAELVGAIQRVDREFSGDPHARVAHLRRLRTEHHIILVADRIRRESLSEPPSTDELRQLAEALVDPPAVAPGSGAKRRTRRSGSENRMLSSARVNWHKLMRLAGSPAELRGVPGRARRSADAKYVIARLRNSRLSPSQRGELLAEHVRDRLEQLRMLCDEVLGRMPCELQPGDRKLLEALDRLTASGDESSL